MDYKCAASWGWLKLHQRNCMHEWKPSPVVTLYEWQVNSPLVTNKECSARTNSLKHKTWWKRIGSIQFHAWNVHYESKTCVCCILLCFVVLRVNFWWLCHFVDFCCCYLIISRLTYSWVMHHICKFAESIEVWSVCLCFCNVLLQFRVLIVISLLFMLFWILSVVINLRSVSK